MTTENPCPKCDGDGCHCCFHTGKRLFEIGDHVVWVNQDRSLDPNTNNAKYMGCVQRVTAIMDCLGKNNADVYYVGIDAVRVDNYANGTQLLFDINLRPATLGEIAAAESSDPPAPPDSP